MRRALSGLQISPSSTPTPQSPQPLRPYAEGSVRSHPSGTFGFSFSGYSRKTSIDWFGSRAPREVPSTTLVPNPIAFAVSRVGADGEGAVVSFSDGNP